MRFRTGKLLEIECIADTDSRSVITVAPGNPVAVFYPGDTWVILVFRFYHIGVSGLEFDWFVIDVPVDTVFTESRKDIHLYGFVVTTEYSGETVAERYNGTVEYTVGTRYLITSDNRIL